MFGKFCLLIFICSVLFLVYRFTYAEWKRNVELAKSYTNIRQLSTQIIMYKQFPDIVYKLSAKIIEEADVEKLKK